MILIKFHIIVITAFIFLTITEQMHSHYISDPDECKICIFGKYIDATDEEKTDTGNILAEFKTFLIPFHNIILSPVPKINSQRGPPYL